MIAKRINPFILLSFILIISVSCSDDDSPVLIVPNNYISENYDNNVTTENTVITELLDLTTQLNNAEASAPNAGLTSINYPNNLASVTQTNYKSLIENWLLEVVKAANSPDGFINPGTNGNPNQTNDEGGLLGSRLLDEYGLELEQMVEKGAFGAALYNHASSVVENIKNGNEGFNTSAAIDRLVEIHGTDKNFSVTDVKAAATYSRRRSNLEAQTGFFFDIKKYLITAKTAIDNGDIFTPQRNEALDNYLLSWEKSNYATVIFYCKSSIDQLTNAFNLSGEAQISAFGNAMHAYAEGVAFTHGFRNVDDKFITDAQIDVILEKLLAVEGENPESYKFLNDPTLLSNFQDIITYIQNIYGFSDDEVESFYVNNNP